MREYPPLRFFPKFFLILNLYANLFLIGTLAAIGAALSAWRALPPGWPRLALTAAAALLALGGLFEYLVITSRLPAKWKFYRVHYKRLQKNGFRPEWFRDAMYEPCMRLLVRDLLRVSGHAAGWPILVEAWKGSGVKTYDDMMKRRILELHQAGQLPTDTQGPYSSKP